MSFFAFFTDFKKLLNVRYKNLSTYFELIGAVYILKIFYSCLIRNFSINWFKRNLLDKTLATGWIIFADGCPEYVVNISVNLLRLSSNYKILLIGKSKDEDCLVKNIQMINKNFAGTEIDSDHKKNNLSVNYLISGFKDYNLFERQINDKISCFSNEEHISVVFLNCDYKLMGFFDKFTDENMNELIDSNFNLNSFLLKYVVKFPWNNNKTRVIAFGNKISNLKLPYFQLYSSSKLALRSELKKLSKNDKLDICYIEDFDQHLFKNKQFSIEKFTYKGFVYTSLSTKLWFYIIKHNNLLNTVYKNIILEKLKQEHKFNY